MSTDKKFPIESCREKIARRHGADAVALSGPCKGASLADCVCQQLEDRFEDVSRRFAGSDEKIVRLATKLSDSFMTEDDSSECQSALDALGYSKNASAGITGYLEAHAMREAVAMEFEGLMGDIEGEDDDADAPIDDEALGDLVEEAPEEEPVGEEPLEGLGDIEEVVDVVDVVDIEEVAGPEESVSFDIPADVVREVLTPIVEEVVEEVLGGEDVGGDEMVEFEVVDEGDLGSEVHEEREMELIEDLGELHEEEVPGEPEEIQEPGVQIVEGGDGGDTCSECGQPKVVGDKPDADDDDLPDWADKKPYDPAESHEEKEEQRKESAMKKVRVKIAYPEQGSGGHDASGGSNKKVEDPRPISDGNLVNEGHSAVGKKFQDGSTIGAEQAFDAATVEASDVSGGASSLQGEDESFPEGGPSVPAGSSPIKNEELTGGDVSTKGTVIAKVEATVTPEGIKIKTPDGKVLLAKTKIAKSQVTKELLEAIGAIEFDGDGRKYAKNALLTFRKIAQPVDPMAGMTAPETVADEFRMNLGTEGDRVYQQFVELSKAQNPEAKQALSKVNTHLASLKGQRGAGQQQAWASLAKEIDEAHQWAAAGASAAAEGVTQVDPWETPEEAEKDPWEGILEARITPTGIAFKIANGKSYFAKVAIARPTRELVAALENLTFDGDVRKFAQAAVDAVKTTKTASEESVTKTDTSKLEDSKFTNDDGPMEAEDQETVGKAKPESQEDGITKTDTAEKEADHFQNTDYENDKVDSGGSKEAAAGSKETKTADDKKVEDPRPISDGNLVNEGYSAVGKKFQDGSTMGAEKPFDAHKIEDSEVSGGTSSLMGEDESLPTDKPSVPAGSPSMGQEPWSGGDVSTKGTVIAENKAKVREARLKAASVYVADLLQHGDIEPNEYSETLEKIASMSVQAIQNLAFSTKKARTRVAKTAAAREAMVKEASSQPGLGVPIVIDASKNRNDDLKDRLVSAFKLTKQLDEYDAMKEKN